MKYARKYNNTNMNRFLGDCRNCGTLVTRDGCNICNECECGESVRDYDPNKDRSPKCKDCKFKDALFRKEFDAEKAGLPYDPDYDFELSPGNCCDCESPLSAGFRCRDCVPCVLCGINVDVPYDDFDTAMCKKCLEEDKAWTEAHHARKADAEVN